MKKLIGFMIVVALLAVGTPYFLGIEAERVYEHTVGLIARESQLPFKVADYKRGLFSSTAITEITMNEQTLTIIHKIQHGPILFDSSSFKPNGIKFGAALVHNTIAFVPEVPAYTTIRKMFGDQDPFGWKSIISFTGGMKTFMYSPAVEHVNTADGKTVLWQGMEGQVSNDRKYKVMKGLMTMPGLTVKSADFNGGFKGLRYDFDSKREEYNIWTGDASSAIDKLEIISEKLGAFVFDDFNLHILSKIDDNLYQGQVNFSLNKAQTPIGIYGPIVIAVRLLNVDPEGVLMVQDIMKNSPVPSIEALKPGIRKILQKTPTLLVENTKLTLPEGDVSIDAKISAGGPNTEESFEKSLASDVKVIIGQEVLKKFLKKEMEKQVKAKPEVAALSPAEQTAQVDKEVMLKIEKLKASGVLTEQAQNYELKFSILPGNLPQGILTVDGKAVNVKDL